MKLNQLVRRFVGNSITKLIVLCCLLVIIYYMVRGVFHASYMWPNPLHHFGAIDFIAFWSGTRIFLEGGNPYSVPDMQVWQKLLIPDIRQINPFLSPPWAIPLFYPFALLPFHLSRWAWVFSNLSFTVAVPLLIYKQLSTEKVFSRQPQWQWLLLSCLLFSPNLMNMYLGQLGMGMVFFTVLMFYFLINKQDIFAGFALIPLSFKPQLLLLIIIPLLIFIIKHRRWKIATVAAMGMLFLLSVVVINSHNILNEWIATWNVPLSLKTATLTAAIRYVLLQFTGELYRWPIIVIPLCGVMGVILWTFLGKLNFKWQGTLPPLMSMSLLFAPYAWFHDFCFMLPIQIVIILITMDSNLIIKNKIELYFWLFIVNVLVLLPKDMGLSIFWYPVAMLIVWWRFNKLLKYSQDDVSIRATS
jgi:hypothetical protein